MENEICNLTGSCSDACPMVGTSYRGSKSDSKNRGYVRGGKVLAMVRLYTQVYEFRPLSEEEIALRLGAAGALFSWSVELQGVRTLVQEGKGGLYRVR